MLIMVDLIGKMSVTLEIYLVFYTVYSREGGNPVQHKPYENK